MYWWTYKGLAPESDSYANLRLAGRSFDLTIHELLCFLFFNPVGPEKYAVWDRLSWDSSVSVRLAVTMSGILHRADLKWRATDSAYCVRLWARKGLERLYEAGGRDPQADLTRAYFNACAVLTYPESNLLLTRYFSGRATSTPGGTGGRVTAVHCSGAAAI